MNSQNNQRSLSQLLQSKTRELFPNDAERILEYFTTKLEHHFNQYKSLKGFTPSENLIKTLFICSLRVDNLKLEDCYFSSSLPFCLKHFYYGALSSRTEYENYPLISPLEYIGSDGGGGSFFIDMSIPNDSFFHIWEEFDGVEKMETTLMDIIRAIKVGVEELYHEVKKEFESLLTDYNYSHAPLLGKSDFSKLTRLAVGIGLENSAFMTKTEFNYSYDYFVTYLQHDDSDYFKYDDIVNTVNSQLLAAFHQLYFAGHKEELQKLIQLSLRKAKGRIFNSHCNFFNQLLVAEVELKNRIIVNFQN